MTVADVPTLKLDAMQQFYRARFANAADFTYFIVGAFPVAELTPLLERWIGALPSTGKKSSAFRDMGVRFPSTIVREEVKKGKDPASQTVISFFADTGKDEFEMHRVRAAANVLSIRLREILREELGGTYGVSVGYDSSLPLPGYGAVIIQFGSSPQRTSRRSPRPCSPRSTRPEDAGPDRGRCEQGEGDGEAGPGDQRAAEPVLAGLAADRAHAGLGSHGHHPPAAAHRQLTSEILHGIFKKYFPMDRYTVVTLKPEV